jgi:hypothetical protein
MGRARWLRFARRLRYVHWLRFVRRLRYVHWIRFVRWLGFDRNPLRRGTDRIEAVVRLLTLLLLLAVPAVAVAAGQWADHRALYHARHAEDHLVTAVLLQQAPATGTPDPYTSVQTVWVKGRWQPPGRPARTGEVPATAGARPGSTVPVWVDASGAVTSPPPDHREIVGEVCVAVALTCLASFLLLLGSRALARRALDRRRMRGWEAEWQATGPLWTGRHT